MPQQRVRVVVEMLSLAEARARLGDLIAWLCNLDGSTERRALLVLRRGRPVAALIPALGMPAARLFAVNRSRQVPQATDWTSFDNVDEARRGFIAVVTDVDQLRSPGAVIEPGRTEQGRIAVVHPKRVLDDLLARRPRLVLERLLRLQPAFRPPRRPLPPPPARRIAAVGRKT